MRKDIKDKFPAWCNSNQKFDLCLTNDIDSLLSCKILEQVTGNKINLFYNFTELYRIEKTGNKAIGVDMALTKGKCWDNHVTMLSPSGQYNKQSANINTILQINRDNYYKKYAMSTLLTVMSYYNIPLPKTEEGKMILLAIDSSYLGHYNSRFKPIHNNYLKMLEYDELIDFLDRHTKQDFENINTKYNLKKTIQMQNNKLVTDINLPELEGFFNLDLSLPNKTFTISNKLKYKTVDLQTENFKRTDNIVSMALTYKNKIQMSIR